MITTLYITSPVWLLLTVIAMIYLIVRLRKEPRKLLLLCGGVFAVLILNDISYGILSKLFDPASYYRFLWVIPYGMLIAYVLLRICIDIAQCEKMAKGLRQLLVLAILCGFFGMLYQTQDNFGMRWYSQHPWNEYVAEPDVVQLAEIMEKEKENFPKDTMPRLATPQIIMLQYQTIDGACIVSTDRVVYLQIRRDGQDPGVFGEQYYDKFLLSQVCEDGICPDKELVKGALEREQIDIMIVRKGMEDYMEVLGGKQIGTTDSFAVYRF